MNKEKDKNKKYSRGVSLDRRKQGVVKSKVRRKKIFEKDKKIEEGLKHAARTEILLSEQPG